MADINAILKSEGKFFLATNIPSDKALCLPSLHFTAINGEPFDLPADCHGKISLLTICFSAYAEPQLDSFRKVFLEKYSKEAGLKVVDLRPLMSRMKWILFARLLRRSASNVIPPEQQGSFIVTYRPMDLLDLLEVPNYLGAYVYLLDRRGRVRWKASGQASDADLDSLYQTVKSLRHEPS